MKKFIVLMLSLSLVLTGAVPAFASDDQAKGLEKAIQTVKGAVPIPKEYTEFNYSSYERETDAGSSVTIWSLEWSKEDGSAAVSARTDSLGNFLQYYLYDDQDNSGLAKVTREEGQAQADAFLEKAMPSWAGNLKPANETQNISMTGRLNYSYQLYVNEIPVPFIHADISVDPYTGVVTEFDGLNPGQTAPKFPDKNAAVKQDEAVKLYAEQLGAQLKYYTYYDYSKKTITVFAGYSMGAASGKAIDAQTGKIVELYSSNENEMRAGASMDKGAAAAEGASQGALTPEELAAVSQVSGSLTKEKAAEALRKAIGLNSGEAVTGSSMGNVYAEKDRYYWQINFDNAWGEVDAKTGEVLSFSVFEDADSEAKASYTKEQALQKAQAFLEKVSAEKYKNTKLTDSDYRVMPLTEKEKQASYSFQFERQINGAGVSGNGLSVTISGYSGEITGYNNTWYESISFPSMEKAMGSVAAFDKFNSYGKLGLAYVMTGKEQVSLVYTFGEDVSRYMLEPVSGSRINWRGEAYQDGTRPQYSDLKGHWAEKTIQELMENGYYLEGSRFLPDQAINQEDFLRYLYMWTGTSQDEFYKMLERNKIVTSAEKAPDQAVTRQDAAKYMVRYLGFEKLAKQNSIFKDLFKDKVADSYKGYAAVCYGLEIMRGDETGRFNGTKVMTRAETACALYQLIQVK